MTVFVNSTTSRGSFLLALIFLLVLPLDGIASFPKTFPRYQIQVDYDHDQKRLEAKMQVRFPYDSRPATQRILLLPMNRFQARDSRGIRRHRLVPVFAQDRFTDNSQDPLFPFGFHSGGTLIHAVRTQTGVELPFELAPNPEVEIGYSPDDGLLRIFPAPGQTTVADEVEIEFSTRFPERLMEGVLRDQLMTTLWHPLVPPQEGKTPVLSLDLLRPAHYHVTWTTRQPGRLIVPDQDRSLRPEELLESQPEPLLLRFPVVFSPQLKPAWVEEKAEPGLRLTFQVRQGEVQRTRLLAETVRSFLAFCKERYHLQVPWDTIHLVETPAPFEEVRVYGNLVLIPTANLQRSTFLDRRSVSFLTRALGQLWFGEWLPADRNRDLWLRLGVPAFLGLQYFEDRYGADATIFDFWDWLNPRYREHFFEQPIRGIRHELLRPIATSFRTAPASQDHLRVVTYKTALVLSMLESVQGTVHFREGLARLLAHPHTPTSLPRLEQALTPPGEDWHWFFEQWFRTTRTLDYALGRMQVEELSEGNFRTTVEVQRLGKGRMPIDVQLYLSPNEQQRRRLSGRPLQETVVFYSETAPDWVSLDPGETLLEDSRINNHSRNFLRVRFAFDWKKQREQLIALIPGLSSNAIDGNSLGIGVRQRFDNNEFILAPGYGSRNHQFIYLTQYTRRNWLTQGGELFLNASEFGGIRSYGLGLGYTSPSYEDQINHEVHLNLQQELLLQVQEGEENASDETGNLSTVRLDYTGTWERPSLLQLEGETWYEQTLAGARSDFDYRLWRGQLLQSWTLGFQVEFWLQAIRGTTDGFTPLQKKFQLGSPEVLRGYPQTTALRDDELEAWRSDLRFPLSTQTWWSDISAYDVQGILFYDQGRIWSHGESSTDRPLRQNVGIGVEWMLDTVSLFQVPLKLELAVPIHDDEYTRPQLVLLGTLTGS